MHVTNKQLTDKFNNGFKKILNGRFIVILRIYVNNLTLCRVPTRHGKITILFSSPGKFMEFEKNPNTHGKNICHSKKCCDAHFYRGRVM